MFLPLGGIDPCGGRFMNNPYAFQEGKYSLIADTFRAWPHR